MFDIAPSELMIVAMVAIVLIGPKDLPRVMRAVGLWVGKGRAMMKHIRGAMDDIVREAEVQERARKRETDEAPVSSPEEIEPVHAPAPVFSGEKPVLALVQGGSR